VKTRNNLFFNSRRILFNTDSLRYTSPYRSCDLSSLKHSGKLISYFGDEDYERVGVWDISTGQCLYKVEQRGLFFPSRLVEVGKRELMILGSIDSDWRSLLGSSEFKVLAIIDEIRFGRVFQLSDGNLVEFSQSKEEVIITEYQVVRSGSVLVRVIS